MRGWNRWIVIEVASLTANGCRNLLRYNILAMAAARGDSPPQPVASHSFESAAATRSRIVQRSEPPLRSPIVTTSMLDHHRRSIPL